MKSVKEGIKQITDKIYLSVADCDGMCNLCQEKLKSKCEMNKPD